MKIIYNTYITIIFSILSIQISVAQEIKINVVNKPLNKLLIDIVDSNNINISFDDESLSNLIITENRIFPSIDKTLNSLFENTNFEYELIDDVWVIYPKIDINPSKTTLSGRIYDMFTEESLPYSHIYVNDWPFISDAEGNYSAVLDQYDSIIHIIVSHLGYYILDTTIARSNNFDFPMVPSSIGLSEIVISDRSVEKATQIGNQAGLMKLNHKIAHFLPGYGDNSVFSLIRLMPGILASGEHTNELIIWGGYAGQSKVMFDGFTVYGLKNFNDNISSFNPLIAKDIEIHKGGYDANYGDRVGGIVNIIGKNGNTINPSFTININNMTLNGMVEIPISKKGSLIFAFRQTYYNLYNPSDMSAVIDQNNDSISTNDLDINVIPDYNFRDFNVKYSTQISDNNNFYVSLHAGRDRFSYKINEAVLNRVYDKKAKDQSTQTGGSVYWGHIWNNGNSSNIRICFSGLVNEYSNDFKIQNPINSNTEYIADDNSKNTLDELKIEHSNSITINQYHTIEGGLDLTYNFVELEEFSFDAKMAYYLSSGSIANFYLQDNISILKNLNIKAGFRINHAFYLQKIYFEPRISASLKIGDMWKINCAYGKYNQFISLSTIVDDFGNFKYLWSLSNNKELPVLNASHYVIGSSYHHNNLTFSIEGYYKNISGLTRFVNLTKYSIRDIFHGKAESYGMDILLKKDLSRHSAWIAYSLSSTIEHFTYNQIENTRRAPQDQRHELKLALLLNFDPIYFSTNYVYGSGFPYGNVLTQYQESNIQKYSRLDASLIYKFLDRKVNGEIGISIINVLNTKNLKYSSFEKIPSNQVEDINIYTEALPITPTLYLKISM